LFPSFRSLMEPTYPGCSCWNPAPDAAFWKQGTISCDAPPQVLWLSLVQLSGPGPWSDSPPLSLIGQVEFVSLLERRVYLPIFFFRRFNFSVSAPPRQFFLRPYENLFFPERRSLMLLPSAHQRASVAGFSPDPFLPDVNLN